LNGDEAYWNVGSDNVVCMCFSDVDEDMDMELLMGSDDCYIRAAKNEEIIFEINEVIY
jgi:hypothetical protein